MRPFLLIICSLILGLPVFSSAELYKYYDKKGNLSFTDDVSKVPEDQKEAAETIREIKTKLVAPVMPGTQNDTPPISGQTMDKKAALKSELEQESKELGVIKKELDEEYTALNGRRDMLIIERKTKMDLEKVKAYNEKANALNHDTLTYKEKKEAYLKRAEAYNSKLESAP
ncbi:MAG: hypothetical protein GY834_17255 [Bacteroidetes bacterium]|nr:hypothetical protein [Bacteroidota bacterium]